MATGHGPRRFGISSNPEDERRLRRIEEELDNLRGLANSQITGRSAEFSRSRQAPQRVTGLSLATKIIGGLSIKWNPVTNPDLRRYRGQISTDQSFSTGVREFKTIGETTFTFPEGDADTTYYVRVRAETKEDGPWSVTLNTTTGTASSSNLDVGAAHTLVRTIDNSPSPSTIIGADTQEYVPTSFTSLGEPMIVVGTSVVDYVVSGGETNTTSILLDDVSVRDLPTSVDFASSGTISTSGTVLTRPAAGLHTVKIQIDVEAGSIIDPKSFDIAVLEISR
jgi:hypothetical protein